ncbi:antibiotic ABC transporter permease [Siphonobacter sp. BAB-5385]|uniref:ABC transporter permease n=1 Tax=Siphonobacter sp. BAB-5385 TaxID=1864822 RepID=UPI000B9E6B58|nr:ABC transporter permease [Siphonobacter sp. BAB-5385]OZI09008.1 antibiotic ABC transporter permease [Siphonobacter sp. BAB-5385]
MLRNYIKIALRNLLRNKGFSIINILGLSIGLACCMLIILYTKDEVSFDAFQARKDQLYRVTCTIQDMNGEKQKLGIAALTQGPSFKEDIPEVLEFSRVQDRNMFVRSGREVFTEKAVWADKNFFTLFSFPLVAGNAKTVLSDIHSLVLTEEMAEKYFGTTQALGKKLEFEINNKFETFVVSGIAKNAPQNSTIQFKMLLPFAYQEAHEKDDNWLWLSFPTYLLLHPSANVATVEKKMNQVYLTRSKEQRAEASKHGFKDHFNWGLQPFLQMHLATDTQYTPQASNPMYSYILLGIALFVLLIACINFVNLTVAQSLRRSREIGIRKVVGGQRSQLIGQFLGESFILCFLAFTLAILLAEASLPFFNELANKELSLTYLLDYQLVLGVVGLFLVTGFAAGFYPALVLSGFDPLQTLYNRFRFSGKNYLSKGLVVLQFSLATFLIITTLFIYAQFNYLTNKDLGYNDKNLLSVTVGWNGTDSPTSTRQQTFEHELSHAPGVQQVAPVMDGSWTTTAKANGVELDVKYEHVDEHFLPAMQIPMVEGRNFSAAYPADSTHSVLVNEAFVKKVGWKGSVLGKTVDFLNGNDTKLTIVGVVKDYHFNSLKAKISPQLFSSNPHLPFGRFLIRVQPDKLPRAIQSIEATYRKMVPYRPFSYDFMDELNYKNYEAEAKWKQIITFGAILTIFISCIGLFGLASLSMQQRTKEIGIRKVLGASVLQLSNLLAKNFLTLVLIAFVVAIPAAWYVTQRWLENFAYRIDITWQTFAVAALLTSGIALVTVSFNTIRTALANPIKSLKSE